MGWPVVRTVIVNPPMSRFTPITMIMRDRISLWAFFSACRYCQSSNDNCFHSVVCGLYWVVVLEMVSFVVF